MIITLTMNPAIDRTITLDHLFVGGMNRVRNVKVDASGKGINVSLALKELGYASTALGLLGGPEGQFIAKELERQELSSSFTWLEEANTRTNVKIVDSSVMVTTEVNEAGPTVNSEDIQRLLDNYRESVRGCHFAILSGSLPPGVPNDFYARLIKEAKKQGIKTVLDASGIPLRQGCQETPFMIKPNQGEAEDLLGRAFGDETDCWEAVHHLAMQGFEVVVLSLGENGALFFRQGEPIYWGRCGSSRVKSTAGCGDALLAATLVGMNKRFSWRETARFAVAAATAAAELEGTAFPKLEAIDEIKGRVTICSRL